MTLNKQIRLWTLKVDKNNDIWTWRTQEQTKSGDASICFPKFGYSQGSAYVSIEGLDSTWVGSLSTLFLASLSWSLPLRRQDRFLHKHSATHTTILGACRATPSHQGGFTSKSNKCFTECLTKSTCAQGMGIAHSCFRLHNLSPSQPNPQDIWRKLTKRKWGELKWLLGMCFLCWSLWLKKEGWGV